MPTLQRRQIAGMNIHYLYYSLNYFLNAQADLAFETIALWGHAAFLAGPFLHRRLPRAAP